MAARRIYKVKNKRTDQIRLVWASNRSQARGYIAIDDYEVEVADQAVLVDPMRPAIEDARDESDPQAGQLAASSPFAPGAVHGRLD